MFRALYTAATGMQAQQTNLDTIANNLSNSSTAGFQSRRMQFQDLIYQSMVMPGAAASQQTTVATGLQVGLGTRSSASEIHPDARRSESDRQSARSGHRRAGIVSGAIADGSRPPTRAAANFTRTRKAMW